MTGGAESTFHCTDISVPPGLTLKGLHVLFVAAVAGRALGTNTVALQAVKAIVTYCLFIVAGANALHTGWAWGAFVVAIARVGPIGAFDRPTRRILAVKSLGAVMALTKTLDWGKGTYLASCGSQVSRGATSTEMASGANNTSFRLTRSVLVVTNRAILRWVIICNPSIARRDCCTG